MKKMIAMALISALAALPGAAMGAAQLPSSEKMLNDYSRYAVVYTSDEERVYVDTETIERDPANAGELPVIRGTLYAEVYKDPLTYPDYAITAWSSTFSSMRRPWVLISMAERSGTAS